MEYLNSDQGWKNINYFAGVFNNDLGGDSYVKRVEKMAPAAVGVRLRSSVTEKDMDNFGTARHGRSLMPRQAFTSSSCAW